MLDLKFTPENLTFWFSLGNAKLFLQLAKEIKYNYYCSGSHFYNVGFLTEISVAIFWGAFLDS